ncbi:MAG: hypothetical protein K8T20_02605 [Planctomycetes bacterium]|nr:hypothetical protein [Planctomycetota bacterium]
MRRVSRIRLPIWAVRQARAKLSEALARGRLTRSERLQTKGVLKLLDSARPGPTGFVVVKRGKLDEILSVLFATVKRWSESVHE